MGKTYYIYILASQRNGTLYIGIASDVNEAIQREKRLKEWKRKWKLNLIEKGNPYWNDLYRSIQ